MRYRDGNRTKYVCDNCDCDSEPDELHIYHGEQLCVRCLLGRFDTVEDILEGYKDA